MKKYLRLPLLGKTTFLHARETNSQYIIFKLNEIFERRDISVIPIKMLLFDSRLDH